MRLRIRPRFCLILIGVMLAVFSISLGLSSRDLAAGAQRLAQVQAERDALADELESLSAELAYAQTDEYIERVARDELGMMRPGEIRYVSSGK